MAPKIGRPRQTLRARTPPRPPRRPADLYRDVAPGRYFIAPVSYNRDFDQNRDVTLAAGQVAYIRIVSRQNWDGACRDCPRDTFYARLSPPPGAVPQPAERAAE